MRRRKALAKGEVGGLKDPDIDVHGAGDREVDVHPLLVRSRTGEGALQPMRAKAY